MMKKMIKKSLIVIAALSLSAVYAVPSAPLILPKHRITAEAADVEYIIDDNGDGTVSVKKLKYAASGNVEIPSEIDGKKVTLIKENAFNGQSKITSLKVLDNVTIEGWAFIYMDELECVELGSGCSIVQNEKNVTSLFYKSDKLASVTIGENCNIAKNTFADLPALTSVKIGGGTTVASNAFRNCPNLETISCTGRVKFMGDPGGGTSLSVDNPRDELTYQYSDIDYNLTAQSESVKCPDDHSVKLNTYGRLPGQNYLNSSRDTNEYGGIWRPDTVQELTDSEGNDYAAYGYFDHEAKYFGIQNTAGWCCILPEDSTQEPLVFEKEDWSFGAAAIDENDFLYIMWAYTISDTREETSHVSGEDNVCVEKYDLSGKLIDSQTVDFRTTNALRPFAAGNANMCVKNGVLGLFFNTEWYHDENGTNHQGIVTCMFDADDLTLKQCWNNEGSHSFGNTAIVTDYGMAVLQMGDAYSRAVNLNTYKIDSPDSIIESYLGANGDTNIFTSPGTYEGDGNPTYCQLGNVAESESTMAFSGSGTREFTSGTFKNSSSKTGKYDAFIIIKDKSLSEKFSEDIGGETRIDAKTGNNVDSNIFWLTDSAHDSGLVPGQTKLVTLDDGSYCVLWEEWRNGKFESLKYEILDEVGNVLRSEGRISGARLSDSSVAPIVEGDVIKWACADKATNSIIWYSVDLEQENSNTEPAAVKAGASVSLTGMIGLNFYIDIPDSLVNQGVYAVLNGPNGQQKLYADPSYKVADGRYCFTYEVSSVQTAKDISLKLVDEKGEKIDILREDGSNYTDNTLKISVQKYLESLDVSKDEKLGTLVSSMNTYFAYAEKYFFDTPLSSNVDKVSRYKADYFRNFKFAKDSTIPNTIEFKQISLVLDSRMDCRLYFTCSDDIKNHSSALDIKQKGDLYYIEIPDINPDAMNTYYSIEFDSNSVCFGPYSYVYSVLNKYSSNSEKADLVDLVCALFEYGNAASNYAGK